MFTVVMLPFRYFTDPDLLDRVPTCFLILAGSYAAMQILGIIMVTRPPVNHLSVNVSKIVGTTELQWLEHLWNHEKMFETGVVQANEC